MKKTIPALLLTACAALSSTNSWSRPLKAAHRELNVQSSIALSDNVDDPPVINELRSISLDFSAPLKLKSVAGNIKLYRVQLNGDKEQLTQEPTLCTLDKKNPSHITLSRKSGAGLREGEEYKITISEKVNSVEGASLGTAVTGYFALNHHFNLGQKGVPSLHNEREQIVCISDIHLGIDSKYAECQNNRSALINFLNQLSMSPNVKELVIAGDMLDEWFLPLSVGPFANEKSQPDFVKAIARNNQDVIDAFRRIIREGKIKVTYLPGNHDLLISSSEVDSIMPGIAQARDVKGLGSYSPLNHPEIVIEHGHRYNFFCAPDPISNKSIAQGSILPPGYFFTRIATTSVVEKHPLPGGTIAEVTPNNLTESQKLAYQYWAIWKNLMTQFPIKEGFDEPIITTNIDGFTDKYAIKDLIPFQLQQGGPIDVTLFKGIQDNWIARQDGNNVAVHIPVEEALTKADSVEETDDQAVTQYFNNPKSKKRVVVFGHTHVAKIIPTKKYNSQKSIYANSGTWIDHNHNFPTMTFVVITPRLQNGAAPEFVDLYQYQQSAGGKIWRVDRLDSQALTGLGR